VTPVGASRCDDREDSHAHTYIVLFSSFFFLLFYLRAIGRHKALIPLKSEQVSV